MSLKQSRKKKEIMGQDLTQAAKALGAAPIPKGEGEAQAKPWSLARRPCACHSARGGVPRSRGPGGQASSPARAAS